MLKETTGAFDVARTHDWQVSTDHESDKWYLHCIEKSKNRHQHNWIL